MGYGAASGGDGARVGSDVRLNKLINNACDNISDTSSIIHARHTRTVVLMTRSKWIPAMVGCSAGCRGWPGATRPLAISNVG